MAERSRRFKPVKTAALAFGALTLIGVPLWLVVVSSFKTQTDAGVLGLGLPKTWSGFENYRNVIRESAYLRSLANSVFITATSVFILLGVGAPAAWAFARAKSKVIRATYWVALVGVLLPLPVVPMVFLMRELDLQGTRFGLIAFTVGSRVSLVVFLMTGFARALPIELEEAAAVDGASRWRIFRSVILPLMAPVVRTAFVILTVLIWNDFFGPLFLLRDESQATLPLGLYRLSSGVSQATAWNYVFTHVVLVSLPLIVLYLVVQRKIVEGVTAGAVRG
jgi:raffinose/stachyose/melibiose transport system permease protein